MSNVAHLHTPRHNDGAEIVASNVRGLLGYHGRTQAQLARALGVNEMYISRRASGATEFKASEIVAVADYFGIHPGELFANRGGGVVGSDGFEPPTSSVNVRALAIVTPIRRVS